MAKGNWGLAPVTQGSMYFLTELEGTLKQSPDDPIDEALKLPSDYFISPENCMLYSSHIAFSRHTLTFY